MKQSTVAMKVMMSVLVIGVLAYMGFYVVNGWSNELATTNAYLYTVHEGVEAVGVLVREEAPITGGGGSYTDLLPSEGERVGKGQTVAILYADTSGVSTRQRIRTLEAEIQQLEYALSAGSGGADVTRLDGDVLDAITGLRAMSSKNDLSGLEDAALNLRTSLFKREDTYGDSGEATSAAALIQSKTAELVQLESSLSSVSTSIRADRTGVFSGVADGYEQLLTPAALENLTPAELEGLLDQPASPPADGVGKLVTGSTWYFAALIPREETEDMEEGERYGVSFSHDYFGVIPMTLERLSSGDGDAVLAVFSARTNLADVISLRVQTVDIVFRQQEGIRVPLRALRVRDETITDENGVEREVQATGVYTVVGRRAEWQPVELLYTGDTFYLVAPANPESSRRLREGDRVILSSDVFDGKVVY